MSIDYRVSDLIQVLMCGLVRFDFRFFWLVLCREYRRLKAVFIHCFKRLACNVPYAGLHLARQVLYSGSNGLFST